MEVLPRLGPARHGVLVSVFYFCGAICLLYRSSGYIKKIWCMGGRRDIGEEALGMILDLNPIRS